MRFKGTSILFIVFVILGAYVYFAEYRGKEIVNTIFAALSGTDGDALLPDDFREQFERLVGEENKKRLICDYIAGMTDAYAIEFYARLTSENARTIFRPL